jgi:hypothetical protein
MDWLYSNSKLERAEGDVHSGDALSLYVTGTWVSALSALTVQ